MPKTTSSTSWAATVIGLILLTTFATTSLGQSSHNGYYRTQQLLSRDSTDKLKAVIKGVSNDLFLPLAYTGSVDESRIYVIGFSMGASSTINSLDLRPQKRGAGL